MEEKLQINIYTKKITLFFISGNQSVNIEKVNKEFTRY